MMPLPSLEDEMKCPQCKKNSLETAWMCEPCQEDRADARCVARMALKAWAVYGDAPLHRYPSIARDVEAATALLRATQRAVRKERDG